VEIGNPVLAHELLDLYRIVLKEGRTMTNPSDNRPGGMFRKVLLAILWGACLFSLSPYAWNQQTAEWKLRVSAESASVRSKPALESPVIATLPKGTLLNSSEAEGAWFRVVVTPGKENVTVIGYIATNDVEILEQKIKSAPDFWQETPEEFHGIGFTLKLTAGWSAFSGGDIDRGSMGLFDAAIEDVSSYGYTQESKSSKSLRTGFATGGDIIYSLGSRIGIGLGLDYVHAEAANLFAFQGEELIIFKMYSTPWINVLSIRLGLFYSLPVTPWLSVCASGGPALFLVKYNYNRNFEIPGVRDDFYQKANANGLGFVGSLGLEAHLNARVSLVLEAQGRYAKISGFEGSEKYTHEVGGWPSTIVTAGTLYYIEGAMYPSLAFFPDASSGGQNAKKAVLDFSGVSFLAGLRFRI
jgi:hypothetical protein